jgi:predicted cobalt transporter CbtA
MKIFRRLFIAAASAGLLSGLFAVLVHQVTTRPIILEAEVYEKAADEKAAAAATAAEMVAPAPADASTAPTANASTAAESHDAHDHEHEGEEWEPQDGLERASTNGLADLLTGVGFALLLICGYVVFIVAPSLGLPPEVPGTAAADLTARQIWWVATAALTAGGLGLLFYAKEPKPLWVIAGLAMIVAPQAIGAPQPDEYAAAAPEALAHRFIVATMISSLLFWAVLGALSGYFYKRFVQPVV